MKKPSLWERYFTKEVAIEFKACLYFFAFLFYYCCYRLCLGLMVADIIHMAEMIFLIYVICYVQIYLLWNFDEADKLGLKEILGIVVCTAIYTGVSYFAGWFDRNIYVTIGFAAYVIFMYWCMYLIQKYRRKIDDKILNYELEQFKNKNDNKKSAT